MARSKILIDSIEISLPDHDKYYLHTKLPKSAREVKRHDAHVPKHPISHFTTVSIHSAVAKNQEMQREKSHAYGKKKRRSKILYNHYILSYIVTKYE
jgi:hypothetical protein